MGNIEDSIYGLGARFYYGLIWMKISIARQFDGNPMYQVSALSLKQSMRYMEKAIYGLM
jgi:hypothetical protein